MKITIESTDKIVHLSGLPARIWEGATESGIKVTCFVTRIAHHTDDNGRAEEFQKELEEHRSPREEGWPLRMIL